MSNPTVPNFRDPEFLRDHIRETLGFYHPGCIDREGGGFFNAFRDDGTVYDASSRHPTVMENN